MTQQIFQVLVVAALLISCTAQTNWTRYIRSPEKQAVLPDYLTTAILETCYHEGHDHYIGLNKPACTYYSEEHPWYDNLMAKGYSINTTHPTDSSENCTRTQIDVYNNASQDEKRLKVYITVREKVRPYTILSAEEHFEFTFLSRVETTTATEGTAISNNLPSEKSLQDELATDRTPISSHSPLDTDIVQDEVATDRIPISGHSLLDTGRSSQEALHITIITLPVSVLVAFLWVGDF